MVLDYDYTFTTPYSGSVAHETNTEKVWVISSNYLLYMNTTFLGVLNARSIRKDKISIPAEWCALSS